MEHTVIYRRSGFYAAFPVLDHLADGRLSVAIPVARFRDHHAVSDWVVLVSTDEGQSWSESDDPTIPANWPGITPREKYDRFCKIMDDGSYLCTGAMGWEVWPAARRSEAEEQGLTVRDHPHDDDYVLIHRPRMYVKRSTDGGKTWMHREWDVPGYDTIIGFPRAADLGDGTILVPIGGRRPNGEDRNFAWRSADGGQTFRLIPLPMGPLADETAFVGVSGRRVISFSRTTSHFIQRWSEDGGRTWTQPLRTNIFTPSSPPHLLKLRDGRILCTFGYRREPMGVRAVLSHDEGETWDIDNTIVLRDDGGYPTQLAPDSAHSTSDNGYAISTQLSDGSIFTTYYITPEDGVTHSAATRWEV